MKGVVPLHGHSLEAVSLDDHVVEAVRICQVEVVFAPLPEIK